MMDILKLMGIALIGAAASLLIKSHRPELSLQIALGTGIILFGFVAQGMGEIFENIKSMAQKTGLDLTYVGIIIKIIGITYIAEFATALCKDAGEEAIAVKLELAGKILILSLAMPILSALLKLIIEIIP